MTSAGAGEVASVAAGNGAANGHVNSVVGGGGGVEGPSTATVNGTQVATKGEEEETATTTTSAATAATTAPPAMICATPGCGKEAKLACPTCITLKILPPSRFCSQECFKSSWTVHTFVHKEQKARLEYRPPPFDYTGPLRPYYVTPMRDVPRGITQPDYSESGIPGEERRVRGAPTMHINTPTEIAGIREACRIGRRVLDLAHHMIRPGVTTEEIDIAVHNATIAEGAYPSPLNYNHFPKSCCTSVNEVICHGIPDARVLQEGDIVNVDISVYKDGFHGDLNETFTVGKCDADSVRLIRTTYESLMAAVAEVRPGYYIRDFGNIINRIASAAGFSVVRSYCGHGIGNLFHCAPNIPHYANNKAIGQCKEGMVFTIEPMINAGTWRDVTWPDDWTSATVDGKRSAQFEHTLLVTREGVEVLTARTADSPPFAWMEPGAKTIEAVVAQRAASASASAASAASPKNGGGDAALSPSSSSSSSSAAIDQLVSEIEGGAAGGGKKKKNKNKK